ncbi:hypothetical protein [Ramlibacter alkalitolerans]|jgi:hypothetical protein|uniref:Zinc ribbon domain-containing protein n=1 Tax=Ramlibacter alkalitolerans TaxID=2039631 RepID=A0ABS1JIU4_9BURK|nr:hypothetical protein [Ramlibacter alkalitolerans]MBL0424129.1 hypothetical protein [Ramlibacter alkalitolerans]
MRFIFYGMAWCCLLAAIVFAGLVTTESGYHLLTWVLLACAILIGGVGYVFASRTTRKCPSCGERNPRLSKSCSSCSSRVPTALGELTADTRRRSDAP